MWGGRASESEISDNTDVWKKVAATDYSLSWHCCFVLSEFSVFSELTTSVNVERLDEFGALDKGMALITEFLLW